MQTFEISNLALLFLSFATYKPDHANKKCHTPLEVLVIVNKTLQETGRNLCDYRHKDIFYKIFL